MSKPKKQLNNYEKGLTRYGVNPKVCILSNGVDFEYLNDIITRFNADITILGSNYNLLYEEENQKPYDLIIYQASKSELNETNNFLYPFALGKTSEKFNKITSIIRSSEYMDEYFLNEFIATNNGIDPVVNPHKLAKNLREIIDIAMTNLIEYKNKLENEQNHTLVKKR